MIGHAQCSNADAGHAVGGAGVDHLAYSHWDTDHRHDDLGLQLRPPRTAARGDSARSFGDDIAAKFDKKRHLADNDGG